MRIFKTLLLLVCVQPLFAQDIQRPFQEKIDLFEAGKEGYDLYRIPGIVVSKQGTVLAYCEARKSSKGDWGPIDILMRRSTDGGKTWAERQTVVHVEGDLPVNPVAAAQNLDKPGDNTANNPVAIVDYETGDIHFLYCLEYMRCFYMKSSDEGATWTEPVEITKTFEAFRPEYDWKVLATGPGHAIQIQRLRHTRGRLVVPVWLSLGTGGHAHRPSVTATIYSDDHGQTWQAGNIAVPDTPDTIFPNETHIVEVVNGILLNTRSESTRQRRLVTWGPDGATDWSKPRFDSQLLEPICMSGLVRVRWPLNRPGVIAFSNPDNLGKKDGKEQSGKGRDRVNVSVKLSQDDGVTWYANRSLEEGFSGYSDLAALPDGTLLCFYERGSTDGTNIYKTGLLTVARFNEAWVEEADAKSPVDTSVELDTIATDFGLADGPSWDDKGTLYFPDVKGEKLFSLERGKAPTAVLDPAGRISASYFRNGQLYLSDNGNGRIAKLVGTQVEVLHQFDPAAKPPAKPNDLVVDAMEGIYVTLTSQNRVAYISPAGQESTAVDGIISPNGIILSPDGQHLYVAAYNPKEIWAYHVTSPGVTEQGHKLATMDDGDAKGADGMSIDSRGNIYCAGATDVWIWNPLGQLIAKIPCPTRPINCTFGDHDLKSLYITGFGGLYRQRMLVRGIAQ